MPELCGAFLVYGFVGIVLFFGWRYTERSLEKRHKEEKIIEEREKKK